MIIGEGCKTGPYSPAQLRLRVKWPRSCADLYRGLSGCDRPLSLKAVPKLPAEIITDAERSAARISRRSLACIKALIAAIVLTAAVAVAVPSLLGSPSWWIPVTLAALVAVPAVLDFLDRLAPDRRDGTHQPPLRKLGHTIERHARRQILRQEFADHGMEVLAEDAGTQGVLPAAEVKYFTVAYQRRRRRRIAVVTAVALMVAIASTAVAVWPSADHDTHAIVNQPVDLAGVYTLTAVGPPSCAASTGSTRATCTVRITLTNISGEDQDIGSGSFGPIGRKGATFYRLGDFDEWQPYAIAVVKDNEFFELRDADFDINDLLAGQTAHASLHFDVRDDITTLDELQLAIGGRAGRIHIKLG
jgi:hypothetical protein